MANQVSYSIPVITAKYLQMMLTNTLVAKEICNLQAQGQLTKGNQINIPRAFPAASSPYVRGTDMTPTDFTMVQDSLVIDQERYCTKYIDNFDELQSNVNLLAEYTKHMAYALQRNIDGKVLYHAVDAGSTVDDGDLGGTAGNPITLSTSNVSTVLAKAMQKLTVRGYNPVDEKAYIVYSPEFYATLLDSFANKTTQLASEVLKNGYVGDVLGFKQYVSNYLPSRVILTNSGQPTANDTLVLSANEINVVRTFTFTFVASIGSIAGNVLIGANAAATYDNLVNAINDLGGITAATGAGTTYVAFPATYAQSFTGPNASKEWGFGLIASRSGTAVTVDWQGTARFTAATVPTNLVATNRRTMCIAGSLKQISLAVQMQPNVKDTEAQLRNGRYLKATTLFGSKLLAQDAQRTVRIDVVPQSTN